MKVIPQYVKIPKGDQIFQGHGFYMRNIPVTISEFQEFGRSVGRFYFGNRDIRKEKKIFKPITNIAYQDMLDFCDWRGHYLPTVSQWVWAARDGDANRKWAGTDKLEDLHKYAQFGEINRAYPHRVAKLLPNAFGLYDMSGNIWEATCDVSLTEPDSVYVLGGAWICTPDNVKISASAKFKVGSFNPLVGFRTVIG